MRKAPGSDGCAQACHRSYIAGELFKACRKFHLFSLPRCLPGDAIYKGSTRMIRGCLGRKVIFACGTTG